MYKVLEELDELFEEKDEAIVYCKRLELLFIQKYYVYKLSHFYDSKTYPSDVYVRTNIDPYAFEVLLAYILFVADSVNSIHGLFPDEIADPILSNLYNVEVLKQPMDDYVFLYDFYFIWEDYCSISDEVKGLEIFQHQELRNELRKIVLDDEISNQTLEMNARKGFIL
ncbi:hypothetical protein [Niallia taxi]|uniref:hypothetical protein n=1 Tax=Niallia taxi TaxID=2499688 RepID=UPI003008B154